MGVQDGDGVAFATVISTFQTPVTTGDVLASFSTLSITIVGIDFAI